MYRRPKFLEILHEIREEMSREADYDMDLFAEIVRSGKMNENRSKSKFSLSPPEPEAWNIELNNTEH